MPGEKGSVIVVEDEKAIADLERLYLTQAGFGVHLETTGEGALAAVRKHRPVALILDIGLPGIDGIEVCRRLRAENDWTPILFVTARDDEVDRLLGLELGADDYITKPFSPRELVVRLKTVLRRGTVIESSETLSVGEVEANPATRTVRAGDRAVDLTATEFDLLIYLMRSPGRVFGRDQLLSNVWGQIDYGSGRTVDVHIAQLRAKLGAVSPIHTHRGVGYSVESGR